MASTHYQRKMMTCHKKHMMKSALFHMEELYLLACGWEVYSCGYVCWAILPHIQRTDIDRPIDLYTHEEALRLQKKMDGLRFLVVK